MGAKQLSNRQHKTRLIFMQAVLRLVVQHGLDRVTVTDIAREADYGRWTFYQYFDSKEDAVWASFVHWMTQLDAYVVATVQHLPAPQREYESWRLLFHAFEQQRAFFVRLDSLMTSVWRERAKEFLIAQFLGHLQAGRFGLMVGVRPEIAARLYVASVMELMEHWAKHPELGDSERLLDEFFIFIFNQTPPSSA